MRVDLHAHYYPEPYVEELKKAGAGDEGGIKTKIPIWYSFFLTPAAPYLSFIHGGI